MGTITPTITATEDVEGNTVLRVEFEGESYRDRVVRIEQDGAWWIPRVFDTKGRHIYDGDKYATHAEAVGDFTTRTLGRED